MRTIHIWRLLSLPRNRENHVRFFPTGFRGGARPFPNPPSTSVVVHAATTATTSSLLVVLHSYFSRFTPSHNNKPSSPPPAPGSSVLLFRLPLVSSSEPPRVLLFVRFVNEKSKKEKHKRFVSLVLRSSPLRIPHVIILVLIVCGRHELTRFELPRRMFANTSTHSLIVFLFIFRRISIPVVIPSD